MLLSCGSLETAEELPLGSPTRADAVEWAVRRLVSRLPDTALVGQLLIVGIEYDGQWRPLLRLDHETRSMLERVQPGAAVFFGQTFASVEQVTRLVHELHLTVAIPPLIATDHEGGLVARLTSTGGIPATTVPPASVVGRAVLAAGLETEGTQLAESLGRLMGRELRSLGITMNFAPVADVDPEGTVGSIGRHGRTYGDDPVLVGRLAAAVASGLQQEGVAAVIKHFPGHGATEADSHDGVAVLESTLSELRSRELRAFSIALASRPIGLMTAHLSLPAVLGTDLPATVSPEITRLAREELGYAGLIITDALNMRSIAGIAPETELVVRAVEAGADMLLKPRDPETAAAALLDALEAGRISRSRLEESVVRILAAKERLGLVGPKAGAGSGLAVQDVLGSAEHTTLVARITELAGGVE